MSPEEILRKYWGFTDFRPLQKEIIQSVLNRYDVIALLPTGGGKSICYQLPALIFEGVTVVVTPLISLMEDQVERLKRIGIHADCIHSGKPLKDVDRILDNGIYGKTKLIYVSPERLENELFITRIKQMKVDLLAIDEAHCISQWGHDFRPAYLRVNSFRSNVPGARVVALTATATSDVMDEISQYLSLDNVHVYKDSFLRKNIHIEVGEDEDGINRIKEICVHSPGKKIVYVRSRRQVQMISSILENEGLKSRFYHAGMSFDEKKEVQEGFRTSKIQIVVATNAFGMGIDVPDVRAVLHYGLPGSLEEYYQEIGRAGRDGGDSSAHLIYSQKDVKRFEEDFQLDFPPFEEVKAFYKAIHVHFGIELYTGKGRIFSLEKSILSKSLKIKLKKIGGLLKALQVIGVVQLVEDDRQRDLSRVLSTPDFVRKEYGDHKAYALLELLMRKVPGIFDDWVKVDPVRLGRQLNQTPKEIEDDFIHWKKLGVLKYFSQKGGPKISFLENRLPQADVHEFQSKYHRLKKLKLKKSINLVSFLKTDSCRAALLLEYFDEAFKTDCLNCDNCNRKPLDISDFQIAQLDNRGLYSVFQMATRARDRKLVSRIQRLHDEGIIQLPDQIVKG